MNRDDLPDPPGVEIIDAPSEKELDDAVRGRGETSSIWTPRAKYSKRLGLWPETIWIGIKDEIGNYRSMPIEGLGTISALRSALKDWKVWTAFAAGVFFLVVAWLCVWHLVRVRESRASARRLAHLYESVIGHKILAALFLLCESCRRRALSVYCTKYSGIAESSATPSSAAWNLDDGTCYRRQVADLPTARRQMQQQARASIERFARGHGGLPVYLDLEPYLVDHQGETSLDIEIEQAVLRRIMALGNLPSPRLVETLLRGATSPRLFVAASRLDGSQSRHLEASLAMLGATCVVCHSEAVEGLAGFTALNE